ncbi:MAG: hypothetical protein AAF311_10605 [Pseudomonadota bacterium]
MRPVINGLAVASAGIAALLALNLLIGFTSGTFAPDTGRSTANMQWLALVGAALAIALGFIGRIQDRRMPRPASKLSDGSIAVGMIAGLLVLALPFVFG